MSNRRLSAFLSNSKHERCKKAKLDISKTIQIGFCKLNHRH